jgi:integrase
MRRMGRPRQRHKDLPRGLYKDAAGRFTLKAFTEDDRARLGGKWTVSVGRDATAARIRWAEAFGFRDHEPPAHGTLAELFDRFVTEDLVRTIPPKKRGDPPRPKYAPKTQTDYKARIKRLTKLYGERKYARHEAEAAAGGLFRTMDVSKHLRDAEAAGKPVNGNRDAAVLGSVYRYAKECGLTEYNPCQGASRNPETPRDQEMHDEIFLELYEAASPVLQCLMDLDVMVGSRVSDLLKITEFDWTAAGLMAIPSKRKRGQVAKKQLFKRTPDLEEVVDRALFLKKRTLARDRGLPGYKPVKSTYLFVSGPEGDPYTESGFQSMMRTTKQRVARTRLAAAGVATPTAEQLLEAVRSIDIHFHDGRARAADDAEKSGQNVAKFLGHTDDGKTARRHYLNRGVDVLTPNPRIKRA